MWFEPTVLPITKGMVVTTARFSEPGVYVWRAVADDTVLTTTADVTVTVKSLP